VGTLEVEACRGNHQAEGIGNSVVNHLEVGRVDRPVVGRGVLLVREEIHLGLGAFLDRQVLGLLVL
jgi:hypothetical protein